MGLANISGGSVDLIDQTAGQVGRFVPELESPRLGYTAVHGESGVGHDVLFGYWPRQT